MAWYIVARASSRPGPVALGPFEDRRLTEWYQRTDRAIPRPSFVVEAGSQEEAVAKGTGYFRPSSTAGAHRGGG